jgi:hypothetical protein
MIDGIDFYLLVLKRISELYNGNEDELCISEKLAELMKELKETNDEALVKKAIEFVLNIFESYYYDDYNAIKISSKANIAAVPAQDKEVFTQTLAQEIFYDDYAKAHMVDLVKIPPKDKKILIDILKKELNS